MTRALLIGLLLALIAGGAAYASTHPAPTTAVRTIR